jgi:bifunctional DNA-binding transcriptional regulator/antitoxin component of YhaV-PrlF toxin-antitoxin module
MSPLRWLRRPFSARWDLRVTRDAATWTQDGAARGGHGPRAALGDWLNWYSLHVAELVKKQTRTRVSSKHQITIGKPAFDEAGLREGDVVTVRALGPGRVELTRLDELFDKHRGRVKGGAGAREAIERLRDEWR